MLKGKTKGGFAYEISDARLNNYDLLEAISEATTNPVHMPKVLTLLFGSEQKAKFLDSLRDEEGFIDNSKVEEEVTRIFEKGKAKK